MSTEESTTDQIAEAIPQAIADMPGLLWKAVGRDYTSRNGLRWDVGTVVTHPTSTRMVRDDPRTYLSLSTEPAETLVGRGFPCRLLRVEPLGEVIGSDDYQHMRCVLSARVVAEVEPWRALGPQGREVAALVERLRAATADEIHALAARDAARDAAAWHVAWVAAWDAAAGDAARAAAGDAAAWDAGDAAGALVVRDLITPDHYDLLAGPVHAVLGPAESWPVPAWCEPSGRADTVGASS